MYCFGLCWVLSSFFDHYIQSSVQPSKRRTTKKFAMHRTTTTGAQTSRRGEDIVCCYLVPRNVATLQRYTMGPPKSIRSEPLRTRYDHPLLTATSVAPTLRTYFPLHLNTPPQPRHTLFCIVFAYETHQNQCAVCALFCFNLFTKFLPS